MQNEEGTCGYRRASPERDRNDGFRQFRPQQIPRNRPSAGHFGLPGQIGNAATQIRTRSSTCRCNLRVLMGAVAPEPTPENPMKQGVEWQVRFQFHLPPVFRPSRSASLDIRSHLEDVYGLQVSPDLISRVTDAVLDEVREWQSRALERMYPIVIFDALRVKIRDADSRMVKNKAVYVALGVTRDGVREVLGLWIADNEGAKFWLSVMTELKNRGVQDVLIAVVDGLKGFPEAITAAFPEATVQTCIVHLVRHSLNFCAWKDRKVVATDLRRIYSAATADQAAAELDAFEAKWAGKYASIAPAWRRAWQEVIPFFAFDPAIRKIIYTTNAIESLNRVIRKSIKTRGSFPTDDAAMKLIYLAIRSFEKDGRNVREWFAARNQFAIMFGERFDA